MRCRQLSISEITVKHHLSSTFDKLGVSSRVELALFALDKGLVSKPAPVTPSCRSERWCFADPVTSYQPRSVFFVSGAPRSEVLNFES